MHGKIVWRAAGVVAALALGSSLAAPVAAGEPQHRTTHRATSFRVDSGSDTVDKRVGDGVCADARGRCTLRAAIQEANASSKAVTIALHRSVDLKLTNPAGDEEAAATGDLDITGDVTVTGSRSARIDAKGIDRAFEVLPGGSLDLTAVKITGGLVVGGADALVGSGGAIANHGELSLTYVTLEGNRAIGPMASGGAVLNSGSMTVTRSTFEGNEATRAGGAIEANGGTTIVRFSTLRDNVTGPTPGNGGAFHLTGAGHVEVHRSRVIRNTASAEGGGLWNSAEGTMVVEGGSYVDNVAAGDAADNGGGALFNDGGTMEVEGAYFGKNDATGAAGSGGAMFNAGGSLVVARSTIEQNTASRAGGGVEALDGTTDLSKVSLVGNTTGAAPGNGGGLHVSGAGNASVTDSTVAWNVAASEGGGLWNNTGTMTVTRVLVKGNVANGAEADDGGGGLFNNSGTMIVSESTIASNRAPGAAGSGGGIFNALGALDVSSSSILDNRATRAGGGIEALEGTTAVRDVTFTGNRTGSSPGNGGAFHLTGAGTVGIADSDVSRNTAAAEGGGLWNSADGTMTVESTTVRKNRAPLGPNVFNDGGTFVLNGEPVPNGNT